MIQNKYTVVSVGKLLSDNHQGFQYVAVKKFFKETFPGQISKEISVLKFFSKKQSDFKNYFVVPLYHHWKDKDCVSLVFPYLPQQTSLNSVPELCGYIQGILRVYKSFIYFKSLFAGSKFYASAWLCPQ